MDTESRFFFNDELSADSDETVIAEGGTAINYKVKIDGKWYSKIQYKGVRIYLGYYDVELDASMAYQTALGKIKDGTFNLNEYKPKYSSKYKGVSLHKRRNKWRRV